MTQERLIDKKRDVRRGEKVMLSCIVPCYNEEDVLELFYQEITNELNGMEYEIILVDDGSRDRTLEIIMELANHDERIKYVSFSRNFGKESAMLAGMKMSGGDYVAILDADLQHPPSKIKEMIQALEEGYDVAATRRVNRNGEAKLKSYLSNKFYKVINRIIDIEIKEGAQDFRIMKRYVVESIINMPEYHRFSKGIFSWVGFKTKWFEQGNVERPAGESKWSLIKLTKYAIDGIVAFSTVPLKISLVVGCITSMLGFIYAIYFIIKTLLFGNDVPGYPSLMAGGLIIGGLILLSIGILGEYIARIYIEVKNRPIYIIKMTNIKPQVKGHNLEEKEGDILNEAS